VAAVVLMAVSGVLFFGIPATDMKDAQSTSVVSPNARPQKTQKEQAESSTAVRTDRHSQEVLQLSRTNSLEGKISKTPEVKQPSIALTSGVVLEEVLTQENSFIEDFDLNSKKLNSRELGEWILSLSGVKNVHHLARNKKWGMIKIRPNSIIKCLPLKKNTYTRII
jgi:hypothetical protein